jgi:4-diphosphocytidyl-2-C-methyl-D-erythritol kinase
MSAHAHGATLVAPAKLTLTLRVLGTRPDGFHELEALTVSLDAPTDTLALTPGGERGVRLWVTGTFAEGVPTDHSNLVARAATRVLPADLGLDIALDKEIPNGAGLGGGSSDAAAVLRYALAELGVDRPTAMEVAADLGSDIPFCVDGTPAWMRGRGERLDPAVLPGPVDVVVAVPPFALATPAVYRAWDELGGPAGRAVEPVGALAGVVDELVNDLEPAAEHVEPRLVAFRQDLEAAAGEPALLAGSGSACWVPCADAGEAGWAVERVAETLGVTAFLGRSLT